MRGTVQRLPRGGRRGRITPACAGNSTDAMRRSKTDRDHPRVCGEQPGRTTPRHPNPGSPSRVRGTADRHHYDSNQHRITPACAGNSPYLPICQNWEKDHPRVCGEQGVPLSTNTVRVGSPPRVRGTASALGRVIGESGITPACAGNSGRGGKSSTSSRDHPRVCGEQTIGG